MRGSSRWNAILGILAANILMISGGCSMIGLGVGAAIDANTPKSEPFSEARLNDVKPGTNIYVRLRDSSEIKGKFKSVDTVADLAYRQRYVNCMSKDSLRQILPKYGQRVHITKTSGDTLTGALWGFDMQCKGVMTSPTLYLTTESNTPISAVSLYDVTELTGTGNDSISVLQIRSLVSKGTVPLRSSIYMIEQEWPVNLPYERIQEVGLAHRRNAKTTGFLIGMAIDITLIALLMISPVEIRM